MYFCGDCKKQFQGGRRIDSTTLWQSYLTEKRTVKELSVMHKCSERTIRRKLKLVAESFTPSFPKEATVIIDTTYFSRTFGVMLFQDATSGKILYHKFVKNETNKQYLSGLEDIKDGGTKIVAVVCDGHTGLLQAITSCPVQMCQFHQIMIIRHYLTKKPDMKATQELLAIRINNKIKYITTFLIRLSFLIKFHVCRSLHIITDMFFYDFTYLRFTSITPP